MITHIALKILDRDFCLLSQLCTETYRKIIDAGNGGTCERIRALKGWGLIEPRLGLYGGYKLTSPLSEITFSYWLSAMTTNQHSPTFRLLSQFESVSVETILRYPPYWGGGWTLPLDHAIGILSCLSDKKPTLPRCIDYPALTTGYLAHAFTRFSDAGLTYPVSRKGVVLTHRFEALCLGDIMPVLSSVAKTYSGMAYHAANTKLVSLLSDKGRE